MHPGSESAPTRLFRRRTSSRLAAPQVQVLDGSTAPLLSARVLPLRERVALAGDHYAEQVRRGLTDVLTDCSTWVESFWHD